MTTTVDVEVRGGVATLTLRSEDGMNLFSGSTGAALSAAYRECDRNDDIRTVVLTAEGRAFCAGADLSAEARAFAPPRGEFSASPLDPPAWQVRKLVIAAVTAPAIGIGLTIALQCDLRFVSADAKLAIPQVRRGMLGDLQSHYTLRAVAGAATAADLLLTGRTILGLEAVQLGVANKALPADEVLPAALELARDVAVNASPAAVALSKQLLWSDESRAAVEQRETAAHRLLMHHPDAIEGPQAWRERRRPSWTLKVSELPEP